MKKGVLAWLLALSVLVMHESALALGPWDLGKLFIDKGNYQLYRIHDDRESIKTAMGGEFGKRSMRNRVRVFQVWTDDGSGEAFPWFMVGDTIFFRCGFDVADDADVTVTLQVKGPDRFRETFTFPFLLPGGAFIFNTSAPVMPLPGYYTFTFRVKTKGAYSVVKGTVSLLRVM
jgi:hypothetical protein